MSFKPKGGKTPRRIKAKIVPYDWRTESILNEREEKKRIFGQILVH